ncbi:hypothetical protein HN588_16235, partial [Candidatus Bathyarchaeota archaeon]|nr:hypothetical protein [Candidatus Bathyarchaeota archaeon]
MDADGTNWRNVTREFPGRERKPTWSPDGTQIAFDGGDSFKSDIYLVNIDGTGIVRLTDHPEWDQYPAWSPDGTQIAFSSDRDGSTEIYVVA